MYSSDDFADYKNLLKEKLLEIPLAHLTADNQEVNFRCPYCGDSKLDKFKTRFYVKVDFNEDEAPFFYCHNCGIKGAINDEFFNMVELYDFDLLCETNKFYKNIKKTGNYKKLKLSKRRDVTILPAPVNVYTKRKMEYLCDRFGTKITGRDLLNFKIILSMYDFLKTNGVDKLTRKKIFCDRLELDYIGFLSVNNEFINMRNIGDIDKYHKRYINYNIFNTYENTKRFFVMPCDINVMKKVNIIICEGVFDAIGIYINILNRQISDNTLIVAVCGSGYDNVIRFIIREYGIIHHKISIYSDTDKNINFYKDLKFRLGNILDDNPINVYYNELGKDCGTSKNNIKLYHNKI